ncbi:MAG: hypothetical protein HZA91_05560 [Verrucomicrobia bacterium]|nr:hypothetical protein [Verrucomicrobiota bacterium]
MKTYCFVTWLAAAALALAAATPDKIKLRDGTELEGTVSKADGEGLDFRTKYGSVHYAWTQVDLNHLRQTLPQLYEFMVQKTREFAVLDTIDTDEKILQFLAGRFVFKKDQNKDLKNYARILTQLEAALQIKNVGNRNKQVSQVATQNRVLLQTLTQRYRDLSSVARATAVRTLTISFYNATDALLKNDYASFISSFTYAKQVLKTMGY